MNEVIEKLKRIDTIPKLVSKRKIVIVRPFKMFGDEQDDLNMAVAFETVLIWLFSNRTIEEIEAEFNKYNLIEFHFKNNRVYQLVHGELLLILMIV